MKQSYYTAIHLRDTWDDLKTLGTSQCKCYMSPICAAMRSSRETQFKRAVLRRGNLGKVGAKISDAVSLLASQQSSYDVMLTLCGVDRLPVACIGISCLRKLRWTVAGRISHGIQLS